MVGKEREVRRGVKCDREGQWRRTVQKRLDKSESGVLFDFDKPRHSLDGHVIIGWQSVFLSTPPVHRK